MLAERQLVGEERRLQKRGLTPEQVRADLIIAASHHEGASRNAVLHDLAGTLDISQVYLENALSGRMPFGDALLDGLYGPSPAGTRPDEWVQLDDFGLLLNDAIRAGLSQDSVILDTETGEVSHVPSPVSAAVPARLDTAPTASPVVADATPSTADPEPDHSADQATPATHFTTSQRAPDGIAPIGQGEQGAPDLADPAGSMPVQPREPAGEGRVGSPGLSPPPTENSFTRVLAELDGMMEAAASELDAAQAAVTAAVKREQLARLTVDALFDATHSLAQAYARAQELVANPPRPGLVSNLRDPSRVAA
jgi:hypothetical protein